VQVKATGATVNIKERVARVSLSRQGTTRKGKEESDCILPLLAGKMEKGR